MPGPLFLAKPVEPAHISIDLIFGYLQIQTRVVPEPGGWLRNECRSLDFDRDGILRSWTPWEATSRMRWT